MMKNKYNILMSMIFLCFGQLSYANDCVGTVNLPSSVSDKLKKVDDQPLLNQSLGQKGEGKLCQGQVYEVLKPITIYRTWNSNNSNSAKGNWWSFDKPEGRIQQYRANNELCPAWSPIDKLEVCELSAKALLVVGTGQSAKCDSYLTYSTSPTQQIYLPYSDSGAPNDHLENCYVESALVAWQSDSNASKYHLTFGAGHSKIHAQICGNSFDIDNDQENVEYFDFPHEGGYCHVSLNTSENNISFDVDNSLHVLNCNSKGSVACNQIISDERNNSINVPSLL